MRDRVLFFWGHLRGRPGLAFWLKERVIAKAVVPARLAQEAAFPAALGHVLGAIGSHERADGDKGGGAALTREKIIASVADKFICIADASKQVDILGAFPLPVEVIPMARSAVARQLVKLGGRPEYRQGVVTDNGNVILDVHGLEILDAVALENAINGIPGVVTVGLFANRGADVALIGTADGVKTIVK